MKPTAKTIGKILKGTFASLVAGFSTISTVLTGAVTFSHITDAQWTNTALFMLLAFGGTFGLSGWAGPTNGTEMPKP